MSYFVARSNDDFHLTARYLVTLEAVHQFAMQLEGSNDVWKLYTWFECSASSLSNLIWLQKPSTIATLRTIAIFCDRWELRWHGKRFPGHWLIVRATTTSLALTRCWRRCKSPRSQLALRLKSTHSSATLPRLYALWRPHALVWLCWCTRRLSLNDEKTGKAPHRRSLN